MPKLITPWTDIRTADLKKYWSEEYSCSQIASKLGGTTRNAVIGKVHRLGLAGRVTELKPRRARAPKPPVIRQIVIRHPSFVRADEPELRCAEIEPRNLTVLDLEPHDCRYPVTDDSPFLFCGQPIRGGSYCRAHYNLSRTFTRPVLTREEQLQKRSEYMAGYRASKRKQHLEASA